MRKWAVGILVLAAAVLFYVACGESPTAPAPTPVAFGSSGPFGPSSGPFGPSSGPYGPCTGPFPGPIPTGCGGGGGGGEGGGATATPTNPGGGTPQPTPTKTATPLPCPSTFTFVLSAPQSLAGNVDLPIPTGNFGNECVVDKAIVSMFASTSSGQDINVNGEVFGALDACGAGVGFDGCGGAVLYRLNFPQPSGSLLGTTCFDLTWDDAAPLPFDPPVNTPPPYSGTWRYPETQLEKWFLNSSFELRNVGGPSDYQLQCLQVVFITKVVP